MNRNFTYNAVHVDGAERIAQIAAQTGVSRLIQVSHLNASTSSGSSFYQSKAEGEEKVKAAFPSATIVRPAAMYGYEDRLLNNMARMLRPRSCELHLTDLSLPDGSMADLVET